MCVVCILQNVNHHPAVVLVNVSEDVEVVLVCHF